MTTPYAIDAIDDVALRVRELERAVAFQGDVVGCHLARRRDDLGRVHLRAGSSMTDLARTGGRLGLRGGAALEPAARNGDHVGLRVASVDEAALIAHLASHGVAPRPGRIPTRRTGRR